MAAGQRLAQPYEAWIAADPFRGGVRARIAGPRGFERVLAFAPDEAPSASYSPPRAARTSAANNSTPAVAPRDAGVAMPEAPAGGPFPCGIPDPSGLSR